MIPASAEIEAASTTFTVMIRKNFVLLGAVLAHSRMFASSNANFPTCSPQVDATDFAARDANRLVGDIAEWVGRKSPYADTTEGGELENVSESVRSVVAEQAMPAASMIRPGFVPALQACGTLGGVDQVGSTEYVFTLLNYRGRGPKICVKTTRTAFKQSYVAAVNALKRNIVLLTNADIRANYLDNGGCKLVCDSAGSFAQCFRGDVNALAQPWPNRTPDSPISFKGLEYTASFMRETLGVEPFDDQAESSDGVMKFVGSQEMIQAFRDELGIQQDIRAATMGRYNIGIETIQGYTFSGPYHGILLGTDPVPLRASGFTTQSVTYGGSTFTALVPTFVEPYIQVTVTNGVAARPNPAWVAAQYEVGFLFGRESFKRLVPARYKAEGWDFSPQITNGGLTFKQLIDAECNAWGDYGQHFYEIERAFQPLHPQAVCAVLYKRCAGALNLVPCD
jgi:hypothetical protein